MTDLLALLTKVTLAKWLQYANKICYETQSFEPPVSFLHCFSFFPSILWEHCHWRGRKSIGVLFRSHHDYLHIGEIMFTNLDSMKSSPLCPGIFVWQAPQRNIQRGQVERIEKALCSSKVTPLSKLANLKYNNIDLRCFVGRQFLLQIYMFFSVTRRSRSDESRWVTYWLSEWVSGR